MKCSLCGRLISPRELTDLDFENRKIYYHKACVLSRVADCMDDMVKKRKKEWIN